MRRGLKTRAPPNPSSDNIFNVDTLAKIIKKLLLFVFIYWLGYFGLSSFWACAVVLLIVYNTHRESEKKTRLQVARAISLGYERAIVTSALPTLPTWVRFNDIEKVEWANTALKHVWQQVNEYAQELVPKILEPAIQGYVSDFKFNHVVLGNVPLRVDGVKVYDQDDKRKIVMDLDISYKGDCYVTFQTFKFTGGIKDIQLHGRLRVVLTPLISRIPLIGGVQAYFMNPPSVDFDLIKLTQILDIPGIRSKIKSTTMRIINSMFLYPNAYSINLSQGVNVSRLATFRTEGILRVHVVEAKNLVNKDIIGKSDPYVVLKVGSIAVQTPVIQNSLNPKWDFWREFEIDANSELMVEVWDKDEGTKDDHLGHARVDISQVAKIKHSDLSISLQGVDKGTIHLRLTWLSLSPEPSDLDIVIKETQMLSPYLHTSLLMIYLDSSLNLPLVSKNPPCPYVELEVEKHSKQTDVEPETCEPVWEKGFTFLLRDPKRAILNIRIYDDVTKNIIGEVSFKVDNLKNDPRMELRRHTFFFNQPHSDASICCSMKLRILKNEYVEEKIDDEIAPPRKIMVKQESTTSNKSSLSQSTAITTESESTFADLSINTILEDETVSSLGQIKLSLSYSQQRQRLIIEVHEINILQKFHSVDPYVRVILHTERQKNNKKKTKVIKNASNPVYIYNERFEYIISSEDLDLSTLMFEVKTEKAFFDVRKRFLGQTTIALTKCDYLSAPFTDWFNLKSKKDQHVYHLIK